MVGCMLIQQKAQLLLESLCINLLLLTESSHLVVIPLGCSLDFGILTMTVSGAVIWR